MTEHNIPSDAGEQARDVVADVWPDKVRRSAITIDILHASRRVSDHYAASSAAARLPSPGAMNDEHA